MSYAVSAPLQLAVFAALSSDAALAGLIDDAIFDAIPVGDVPPLYVRLGEEEVRDASDGTGAGAIHVFSVAIVSTAPGYADAKGVAGAISDALHNRDLTLSRGRLVSLQFERASAKFISAAQARQIDMQFRARVQDG
ncbi:DUF3168 domain-containing protein [Roseobacter sp. GAI101]|uniref:DUF3168 domain-containing protein n=1 Tax=Roseobacter sp. (strain GAI101) TaxID=391589 RepID=UPI0001871E4C|nr:DUF3168 domain-containing protein [Roseobacter sp. GAI101]EEB84565.1 conserved hypothetical protein [Roseobacter sp. GAI101]